MSDHHHHHQTRTSPQDPFDPHSPKWQKRGVHGCTRAIFFAGFRLWYRPLSHCPAHCPLIARACSTSSSGLIIIGRWVGEVVWLVGRSCLSLGQRPKFWKGSLPSMTLCVCPVQYRETMRSMAAKMARIAKHFSCKVSVVGKAIVRTVMLTSQKLVQL